jgi:hypothetical protein
MKVSRNHSKYYTVETKNKTYKKVPRVTSILDHAENFKGSSFYADWVKNKGGARYADAYCNFCSGLGTLIHSSVELTNRKEDDTEVLEKIKYFRLFDYDNGKPILISSEKKNLNQCNLQKKLFALASPLYLQLEDKRVAYVLDDMTFAGN